MYILYIACAYVRVLLVNPGVNYTLFIGDTSVPSYQVR